VKGRAWDFAAAVDIEVNPQRCGFGSDSDFALQALIIVEDRAAKSEHVRLVALR
jgi:hypothetical protein